MCTVISGGTFKMNLQIIIRRILADDNIALIFISVEKVSLDYCREITLLL